MAFGKFNMEMPITRIFCTFCTACYLLLSILEVVVTDKFCPTLQMWTNNFRIFIHILNLPICLILMVSACKKNTKIFALMVISIAIVSLPSCLGILALLVIPFDEMDHEYQSMYLLFLMVLRTMALMIVVGVFCLSRTKRFTEADNQNNAEAKIVYRIVTIVGEEMDYEPTKAPNGSTLSIASTPEPKIIEIE